MTSRSRVLVAGLVAALCAALLPGLTASAQLDSDGSTAADARAISQLAYPDGADAVVVARDDVPIDALAAGYAVGAVDGPLVLTATAELTDEAEAEITRLGATEAYLLGGTAALSATVADELAALGLTVTRFDGSTRFGTAEAVAAALGPDATTGVLARAFGAAGNPTSEFADSIGAGILGAAFGWPIFLTETDVLTGATRAALETSPIETLFAVGGTAAIAESVLVEVESLGIEVIRLAGDDRAVTAAAIADHVDQRGPGVDRVILVDGYVDGAWASGFAAAALAGGGDTVVLLANGDVLPEATADFLAAGDRMVVCGPNTSPTACAAAGGDATGAGFAHVGTFPVTDNGSQVAEIIDVSEDGTVVVYSDSDLGEVGFVDITDPTAPQADGTVAIGGETTSVAVAGDLVLATTDTSTSFTDPSGELAVIDLATRQILRTIDLGGQPDAIAVAPSGTYAAIAIENQRDEDTGGGLIPQAPPGELIAIDISGDVDDWTLDRIDLTGLADTAPEDPEVEYVDINDDDVAVVTLQENNHLVVVDLPTGEVVNHFSAGSATITDVDATEEEIGPDGAGVIRLTEQIERRREPDAVAWVDDDSFATSNEGDYEDADGVEGGSRSFTIFNVDGEVEYEAGNAFEHAMVSAGHYTEDRSGNKGVEPEGNEVGTYGEDTFLFVGAERTHAVGVYDVTQGDPELVDILPTGIGPEGLKAVPSRDLFVVSSENSTDDIPSLVTIYRRGAGGDYPQLVSVDVDEGGMAPTPVPWGALSGAVGDGDTVHAVSDSYYGLGFIYRIDTSTSPATIQGRTQVGDETANLDLEGIALAPEGGFWLASEGDYADDGSEVRPNEILRVTADGAIVERIGLPAELVASATGSGLEGVAVTADGTTTEYVYVVVQREWADDADGVVKIGRYDVAAGEWGFADYALDTPPAGGWVGLSEITLLPDGTFVVIERDNQLGPAAQVKRVYTVALGTVDFVPYGEPRQTVPKVLLLDVLPLLEDTAIWTPDKLESLAVVGGDRLIAITDNDGVGDEDALGATHYLQLGSLAVLEGE